MTTPAFSAAQVMAGLTPFQRNTVEHVIDRFHRSKDASRFLVADETGLGKTIVARGVIARTIEELQHDDSVDRIDIVYVCSNADLAEQNLAKLNVTGNGHHAFSSRLTLLAKHSRHLRPRMGMALGKPVNLVSFTPGTSFDNGWRSGKAEERAMLYLLLDETLGLSRSRRRQKAAWRILQGTLQSPERLGERIRKLLIEIGGDLDETVQQAFLAAINSVDDDGSLLGEFVELLDVVRSDRARRLHANQITELVGKLRSVLARESVRLLEPDLIILDEFQRFRQLIDSSSEAGELAHYLFDHGIERGVDRDQRPIAKTLLLSATPYKPFTFAEEDEDHHKDFLEVVTWLSEWGDGDPAVIGRALAEYRDTVIAGNPVGELMALLRTELLRVMVRTERPRSVGAAMSAEVVQPVSGVSEDSLLGYVALKRIAAAVGAPMSIEYWKSSPFFANFMDGYKVGQKVREAVKDPDRRAELHDLLAQTRHLDLAALDRYEPLDADFGNARLRSLKEATIDAGWWQLLWVPPSLPYLVPKGPYADYRPGGASMTKRLIFSSWTATPTSVASLLSYEADRLAIGSAWVGKSAEERDTDRKSRRGRLSYRMDSLNLDRPATMAHLALFWPMPGLADLADPLAAARTAGGLVEVDAFVEDVCDGLPRRGDDKSVREASHWFEAFARTDSLPDELADDAASVVAALRGEEDAVVAEDDDPLLNDGALARHVGLALQCRGAAQDRRVSDETLGLIAEVAAHSPGNIAWRALQRVSAGQPVSDGGLWKAAARLASGLRTVFARPETSLLLDQLITDTDAYWQSVLRYCAWGNLQAVLDEYIHHVVVGMGSSEVTDEVLLQVAGVAADALRLRVANYEVFDPARPESRPKLSAHFALRYGGRRQDQESARQPQVRQAFNSPFRPFVLATTSVGQEGIDFHWWCHALTHWNTPASPIDFEQREGRVDRYDGHAVRLNMAHRHREEILSSDVSDPWDAAYEIAAESGAAEAGAFAPHWVYAGPAKIERQVMPYSLSKDEARLARIKRDVALYRLTFGQPRQEDMLELLRQQYSDADPVAVEELRLDLSAPHALVQPS